MSTYPAPEHGWTCFYCGETFAPHGVHIQNARDHFGHTMDAEPACRIARKDRGLVQHIRELEAQIARYRSEDSDADRAYHALVAKHAAELRDAEQRGFDRGMADMREHGYRLNEERDRPDLYPTAKARGENATSSDQST